MNYAQFKNLAELREELTKVDKALNIDRSGIPLTYDDSNLYLDTKDHHTLVIGSTGSGKTQTVVLPQIKLAMYTGESLIIKDNNGEIYERTAKHLEDNGYKVLSYNLHDTTLGNNYNPLALPYKYYKEGNIDEAQRLLENIGYYLFQAMDNSNADPFWSTSAMQLFVGLALYLFENGNEDGINFNSIYDLTNIGEEKKDDKTYFAHLLNKLDRMSPAYINLSGTLLAPTETRGGILSVFKQIMRLIVSRQSLSNLLSTSDYDLTNICNDKVAIFLIGEVNAYTIRLEPLFIDQVHSVISNNKKREKRLNIILDEFESLAPLYNFSSILNSSRPLNIKFTLIIKSLIDLERQYGKENTEILKYTMGCIIYLLSTDIYTQEEISRLCGNKAPGVPLITPEEIKLLNVFEAIVLMPRILPIKTKLLPDYQIPWELKDTIKEQPKRVNKDYKLFDIKKYI